MEMHKEQSAHGQREESQGAIRSTSPPKLQGKRNSAAIYRHARNCLIVTEPNSLSEGTTKAEGSKEKWER